ncbi:hypothetical protein [Luteococcus sp.]|uniref:hypothetical protein n=1 Tax=Luteococcus sp. TaxID=1969402 RepID=UPI0037355F0A
MTTHFVLAYDRVNAELLHEESFADVDMAVSRRLDLESRHADRRSVEVVLLGARSIDDLHRTHRRYFESTADLVQEFATA